MQCGQRLTDIGIPQLSRTTQQKTIGHREEIPEATESGPEPAQSFCSALGRIDRKTKSVAESSGSNFTDSGFGPFRSTRSIGPPNLRQRYQKPQLRVLRQAIARQSDR